MGQVTSPRQAFLRSLAQRREDANLDRDLRVSAKRHRQKAPEARILDLHIATDLVSHAFRENACKRSAFLLELQYRSRASRQPIESTMILTGH